MKRLSLWILEVAEEFFLKTHGWNFERVKGRVRWIPPDSYPFRRSPTGYTLGHAINAQKQVIYNIQIGSSPNGA